MAYAGFTLKKVAQSFGLQIVQQPGAFAGLPPITPRPETVTLLQENVPLAVAMNTEKARSELIVSNVLLELRRQFDRQISFFSGIEFKVDEALGLSGYCDFLVSLSPEQLFLAAPVIALVEAKNDNLPSGLGQCIAEMVAAERYNTVEGNTIPRIYGTVTSGIGWMFLRLEDSTVTIDSREYTVDEPERILGILHAMVRQVA